VTHLAFTVLVAVLLSVALAMLGHRSLRERFNLATYLFLSGAMIILAGSWVMYLIHG